MEVDIIGFLEFIHDLGDGMAVMWIVKLKTTLIVPMFVHPVG